MRRTWIVAVLLALTSGCGSTSPTWDTVISFSPAGVLGLQTGEELLSEVNSRAGCRLKANDFMCWNDKKGRLVGRLVLSDEKQAKAVLT